MADQAELEHDTNVYGKYRCIGVPEGQTIVGYAECDHIAIRTTIDHENAAVIQTELRKTIGDTVNSILKTRDKHIRAALIELGWTPPSNTQEEV